MIKSEQDAKVIMAMQVRIEKLEKENAALKKPFEDLAAKMKPMDRDSLLVAFKIESDNLLLRGIIHLLRACQAACKEHTRIPSLPLPESKYFDGGEAQLVEAEEQILQMVEYANKLAQGKKPLKEPEVAQS